MPVSRKNRSMKKSSKRSNVRTNKKTSKHMRKMRGGAVLNVTDLDQTVDFIIYSGNKVLVSPNENVVDGDNNLALLGTFATASVLKVAKDEIAGVTEDLKINHSQADTIKKAIEAKLTTGDNTTPDGLQELTPGNAYLLLKKSLDDKNPIDKKYLKKFKDLKMILRVEGDKRLNATPVKGVTAGCAAKNKENGCAIYTQLFSVEVPEDEKVQKLFEKTENESFDGKALMWIDTSNPDEYNKMFTGHKNLLVASNLFPNIPVGNDTSIKRGIVRNMSQSFKKN